MNNEKARTIIESVYLYMADLIGTYEIDINKRALPEDKTKRQILICHQRLLNALAALSDCSVEKARELQSGIPVVTNFGIQKDPLRQAAYISELEDILQKLIRLY